MATTRRIHNENDVEILRGILGNKGQPPAKNEAAEPTRRAALGNLGNRELRNNNVQKNYKQVLKEVKPKVDTHWRKNEAVLKRSTSVTGTGNGPTLVQSNSLNNVSEVGVQRRQEVRMVTIKSTKTTTTTRFVADPEKLSLTSRMLSNVDDIDAMDKLNPLLVSEYVTEIYQYLQRVEKRYKVRENFLESHSEITSRMRSVLIDWINEVHFQFHLLPETYFMAVGLIDLYLQNTPQIKRKHLQLVGTTAIFIASKYEELYPPVLTDFVFMTDNTYSDKEVIQMEKTMLKELKFELCRPVTIQFLRRYSKAASAETSHHVLGKYFIELATVDYSMAHHSPSITAASALYLSLILLKTKKSSADETQFCNFWNDESELKTPIWTPTLAHYSNYSEQELRPIVQKIAQIVVAAPKSKTKSVFTKYSQPKFDEFALIPELSGNLIKFLATRN